MSCARGATSRTRTSCRSTTSTSGSSIRTSSPSSRRTASARRLINDAEEIPGRARRSSTCCRRCTRCAPAHAQRVYHRGLKPEQLLIDALRQRQGLGLRLHADRRARSRGDPPDLRRHGQRRVHGAGALHRSDGGRSAGRHLRARHHLLRAADAEAAGPALADAVADQPDAAARHRRHLRSDDARREERALRDGRRHPRRHRQARGHGSRARPPEPGARRREPAVSRSSSAPAPKSRSPARRSKAKRATTRRPAHRPYSFQQRRKKI